MAGFGSATRFVLSLTALVLPWVFSEARAHAEPLPTLSLSMVTDEAEIVVTAKPVDPWPSFEELKYRERWRVSMRYRILEVLKGGGVLPGALIRVQGLSLYAFPTWDMRSRDALHRDLRDALLFLRPAVYEGSATIYEPVLSGIRWLLHDGDLLYPQQFSNPGPMVFVRRRSLRWQDLLAMVREVVERIEGVRILRRIDDPAQRNAAILEWAADRAAELEASPERVFARTDEAGGYGGAVDAALQWVVESCRPVDAWSAISFFNRGRGEDWAGVSTRAPAFCSREGRALLARVAADGHRSVGERRLALDYLDSGRTLRNRSRTAVPEREAATLANTLSRMAQDPDTPEALARDAVEARVAVLEAQTSGEGGTDIEPLLARYRTRPVDESGNVNRNAAARRLHSRLDTHEWEALSGNPRGILVTFYLFPPDEKGGLLQLKGDRLPMFECPTLVLEHLAENGDVLETRRMRLPVSNRCTPPQWSKGWTIWDSTVSAIFSTTGLAPGIWRVTVEGKAGGSRVYWRSEHQGFVWPPRGRR